MEKLTVINSISNDYEKKIADSFQGKWKGEFSLKNKYEKKHPELFYAQITLLFIQKDNSLFLELDGSFLHLCSDFKVSVGHNLSITITAIENKTGRKFSLSLRYGFKGDVDYGFGKQKLNMFVNTNADIKSHGDVLSNYQSTSFLDKCGSGITHSSQDIIAESKARYEKRIENEEKNDNVLIKVLKYMLIAWISLIIVYYAPLLMIPILIYIIYKIVKKKIP